MCVCVLVYIHTSKRVYHLIQLVILGFYVVKPANRFVGTTIHALKQESACNSNRYRAHIKRYWENLGKIFDRNGFCRPYYVHHVHSLCTFVLIKQLLAYALEHNFVKN